MHICKAFIAFLEEEGPGAFLEALDEVEGAGCKVAGALCSEIDKLRTDVDDMATELRSLCGYAPPR